MVIKLNNEFEDGRLEFDQKNFEEALNHFEQIGSDDEGYEFSLLYRISCLMKLKRYEEALSFLNFLIEKYPYEEILWFDKAWCHIFLGEKEKAFSALETVERVVDSTDKVRLLQVAKMYNCLNKDSKVIEYCDKALDIDENYREAVYEKITAIIDSDNQELIDDVSNKIIEMSDKNILALMPVFLLRLFSDDYGGCVDLLDYAVEDDECKDLIEMLKAVIFNSISEDLNAQILLTQDNVEIAVDDALKLMLEFKETGKDFGIIHGVQYFIL
jgi:tetratricopeptide (TPR) repeat protein